MYVQVPKEDVASSLDSLYVNTAALALPSDAPSAAVAAPAAAPAPAPAAQSAPQFDSVSLPRPASPSVEPSSPAGGADTAVSRVAVEISPAPAPQAILYELPDGSKVDVSVLERSLAANAPILSRAVIHHIPGQNFFVSLLALRTQVDSAIGSNSSAAILLHDDVIAAIAARGSSATSTMEAKSDK